MGAASMIGLGLALAQPKRRVLVITGDGEMLMSLGALATIAVRAAGQSRPSRCSTMSASAKPACRRPIPRPASISPGCATAAGIRTIAHRPHPGEVTEIRDLAHQGKGPVFAQIKINPEALAS